MLKILNRCGAAVFMLILLAPALQAGFRVFPDRPLNGVEVKVKAPKTGVRAWFDGSFQETFETWLNAKIGLRSCLVRTYNQMHFSLFGKIPSRRGTTVVIGKDYWLYEVSYIQTYNRKGRTSERVLKETVADVKRLQDELKARGKAFLLVISPAKVEIYPEYAPAGALEDGREQRLTDYDRIRPLLEAAGVNTLDAHQYFLEKKASQPYPLFSSSGTHWNYYGAGMIVDLIMERLGQDLGKPVPRLECRSVVVDRETKGTDNDLGDLLNLWSTRAIIGPQVHPIHQRVGGDYAPDVLLVGDSFSFTLSDIIRDAALCKRCDIFFYFRRHYTLAGQNGPSTPIDDDTIDWKSELLDRDAVIIEINEHMFPQIGFGFVQAALAGLERMKTSAPPP